MQLGGLCLQSICMRLLSLVSLIAGFAAATPAHADSKWVFVPALEAPDARADKLVRSFEAAAGDRAVRNANAAKDFERLRSRESLELAPEEVARIEVDAQAANRKLGSGELGSGQTELKRVEGALSAERGDAYRRSRSRVETLWDACTMSAMLLERAKRHAEASAQITHCIRAYPSFKPDAESEIEPLYNAAVPRIPYGILRIDGGDGCVLRANGIDLGRLPLEATLPVDSYRVQVECVADVVGRVHSIHIREGANQFAADALDSSVHTKPGLWLQRRGLTDSDAQQLGSTLGTTVVLLIPESDSVRVRVDERDIAVVAPGDDVRSILPLLDPPVVDSREAELPQSPPPSAADLATPAGEYFEQAPRRSSLKYVAGIGLLVAGTGALTAAWILYAERYSLRSRHFDSEVPYASRDRFAGLGTAVVGLSGLGALLLTAAEPFLVSGEGIPSAAWVLGAGGLALVGTGIGFGLAHHCEPHVSSTALGDGRCGFVDDATFGPLLALHGLPLLALPAMYGLRQLFGSGSSTVLGFDGRGGRLVVRGTF